MGDMNREICSWENLRFAHRRASRGKRGREAAAAFEYHLVRAGHVGFRYQGFHINRSAG